MANENEVMRFFKSMRAVMWGFLGVRKGSGQEEDMASLTFVQCNNCRCSWSGYFYDHSSFNS